MNIYLITARSDTDDTSVDWFVEAPSALTAFLTYLGDRNVQTFEPSGDVQVFRVPEQTGQARVIPWHDVTGAHCSLTAKITGPDSYVITSSDGS